VGCGTGENALYLAARGREVLGVDAAPVAIERATAKAQDRGVEAEFVVWDALRVAELGRTFDTGIAVGLFHSFPDEERPVFAHNLHAVLEPGGRYFTLCCSERNEWGYGPRRVTQAEIRETFAEGWTVDSIEDASFETNVADGRSTPGSPASPSIRSWQDRGPSLLTVPSPRTTSSPMARRR
jgi:cyclopropane fatty-acyl-phospholipid synthase-like methyltransferase